MQIPGSSPFDWEVTQYPHMQIPGSSPFKGEVRKGMGQRLR
jgi:hypothetical protein